jgi:uncharacterized protein CbrC (UPF0167 family)
MAIDFSGDVFRLLAPMEPLPSMKDDNLKITHVQLRPLYAPDIAKMKQILASLPPDTDQAFKFYHVLRNMCMQGVIAFLAEGVVPVPNSSMLVAKLRLLPLLHISILLALLTKGRTLITSSYKCVDCGKHTIFDLDPLLPSDDVESYRRPMIDYAQHYSPEYLDAPVGIVTHEFTTPHVCTTHDGKEQISIKSISVLPPNIGDYTQYSREDGFAVGEITAIFENIVGINDFPESKSKELKKSIGREKMMRMNPAEYSKLIKKIEPYSAKAPFEFDCAHCGTTNRDRTLEPTNLFDFLTA